MPTSPVMVGYLHPGHVTHSFLQSYVGLLLYDAGGRQRILSHQWGQAALLCGSGGIPDGRNNLAAALLESDVDWLFMVDTDMGFDPDTLERLIEAAHPEYRPIVGGLAFAFKRDGNGPHDTVRFRPQPTLYRSYESDTAVGFTAWYDYPRNELVQVAATGAACVLIHRNALQAVADKYGPVWFDPIRHPKAGNFSEDLSFCVRANATGQPIHVHTGILTTHDKGNVAYDQAVFDTFPLPDGAVL